MPVHNGVHISLISQYDAMLVPEYRSPTNDMGEAHDDESNDGQNAASHHIDAYIPNYAASQFWIRYACDTSDQEPETRFFYFKLFLGGEFIVAWGCGAQEGWMGETLCVPSERRSDKQGPRERLGLFFPPDGEAPSDVPTFEIRIHRARARKREERQYADSDSVQGRDNGVRLNATGTVERGDPQRFYTYALLDPKDEPYVCFRYHVRAYDELKEQGFVKQQCVRIILPMQFDRDSFARPVSGRYDHHPQVSTTAPRRISSPRRSTIRLVGDGDGDDDDEDDQED